MTAADGPAADAPGAASKSLPPPPPVPPGVKARVLGRSLAVLLGAMAVAFGLASAIRADHEAQALGIALGHVAAQVVGLTWIVGAVRTFDASSATFFRATLGLAPVRAAAFLGALLLGPRLGADASALFASFVATALLGHVVEALALNALADAARPPRRKQPETSVDPAPTPAKIPPGSAT